MPVHQFLDWKLPNKILRDGCVGYKGSSCQSHHKPVLRFRRITFWLPTSSSASPSPPSGNSPPPETDASPQAQKYCADAAVNIALDFSIFCIPIPVVWAMTLPWRQKLWLYFVFTLGFFVCIVSCIRFHFLWYVIATTDKPFEGIRMAYWSTIEMNVAIILACIPTLKPLMTKICPWVLNSVAVGNSTSQIPTLHYVSDGPDSARFPIISAPEPRPVGGRNPEMGML